jgi:hypothetical protein
MEINPFHVCSVAENTTEINHTGKLICFIRGGIIVERIINKTTTGENKGASDAKVR